MSRFEVEVGIEVNATDAREAEKLIQRWAARESSLASLPESAEVFVGGAVEVPS